MLSQEHDAIHTWYPVSPGSPGSAHQDPSEEGANWSAEEVTRKLTAQKHLERIQSLSCFVRRGLWFTDLIWGGGSLLGTQHAHGLLVNETVRPDGAGLAGPLNNATWRHKDTGVWTTETVDFLPLWPTP
jgi:hypothetical protein